MGTFLDSAAQFANLDVSYIMDTVTRQIVASFTNGGTFFADIQQMMASQDEGKLVDYYELGAAAGRLVKVMLDFTINN